MTTPQATDNATTTDTDADADTRRITEQDSDYQRCLRVTLSSLRRSLKVFVAELRAGDAGATSRFIHRHTNLLREAYTRAHAEGQHDYWQHLTNEEPAPQEPDEQQVRQRLSWYALASVLKMAHEGQSHVRHTPRAQIATTARLASEFADGTPSDGEFVDSLDSRVTLQANITWPGMQDGYSDAGASDSASPYTEIYWNLEPVKTQHCSDCPQVAGNSPYDPPWGGPIGRQLNQTPGDGRTECGAGCHCDLSYTFPTDTQMHELAGATGRTWNGFAPDGTNMPTSVPMPTKGQQLNTAMIAALDNFRSAWDQWETVRGDLPNAPTMFGTNYNGEELPPLDTLSPEQQIVILQMQDALWSWVEAYEASDASQDDTGDSEA